MIFLLQNFRLDFHRYSEQWHGTSATIVETENSAVWGVVWELDKSNLATLDYQEGVQDNIYRAMSVNVKTPDGKTLNCRVYQQCNNPKEHIHPEDFPMDKRPSPLYLYVIICNLKNNCNNLNCNYLYFQLLYQNICLISCRSTILKGAEENNLPIDYIKFLKTIPHNGYEGEYDRR